MINDKNSKKYKGFIVVLLISVISFFMTAQSIHFPLSNKMDISDSSVYQYLGHLITIGKTPYVDGFDHKGPLLYLINAIGLTINGKWGIWLVDFLFAIGCGLFYYHTAFSIIKKRVLAVIIAILVLSTLGYSYWIGNTPDYYAMLFLAISFDCVVCFKQEGGLRDSRIFIAGVAIAAVFWLKANMVGGIAVFCFCIFIYEMYLKDYTKCIRYAVFALLGFISASVVILAYYAANNALAAMIQDYFFFSKDYVDYYKTLFSPYGSFYHFCRHPIVFIGMISIVIYFIIKYLIIIFDRINCKKKVEVDLLMIFSCLAFYTSLILVIMPGSCYDHYETLVYPPILIELSCLCEMITKLDDSRIFTRVSYVLAVIVLCFCFVNNCFQAGTQYKSNLQEDLNQTEIINFVIDNTSYSDKIAVISPDLCGFYLATNRESATDAPYIQAAYYNIEEGGINHDVHFWEDYAEQIKENKPKVIIYDLNLMVDVLSETQMADVMKMYSEVETFDRYQIYIRN